MCLRTVLRLRLLGVVFVAVFFAVCLVVISVLSFRTFLPAKRHHQTVVNHQRNVPHASRTLGLDSSKDTPDRSRWHGRTEVDVP